MAKPRTNDAAIEHWAQGICAREPAGTMDVNSIVIAGDAIFHYGRHWPMGVIDRRANGTVRAVYVNSNDCTANSGWGHGTNSVTSDVRRAAETRAAWRNIPVIPVPMGSSYVRDNSIRCKPKDSDPEPPANWSLTIPAYFFRSDPGEEPVDDGVGCIAGIREEFEYGEDEYMHSDEAYAVQDQAYVVADPNDYFSRNIIPGAFTVAYTGSGQRTLRIKRAYVGSIYYGRADSWWQDQREQEIYTYDRANTDGQVYKQCPHCKVFRAKHEQWHVAMYGARWGRGHGKGYELYSELMDRYGSEAEWRSERLTEFRRVREGRKAHAAWLERNTVPADELPVMGGANPSVMRYVPKLDPSDGLPFRKDSEAYFLRQRKRERQIRRLARQDQARQRHERNVQRFATRMRTQRKLKQRRDNAFVYIASELADTLAQINVTTNEQESEDA